MAFTPEEDNILHQYYPLGGSRECCKYLPDKPLSVIGRRARWLKIKFLGKVDNSESNLRSAIECSINKLGNRADKAMG